MNLRPFAKLLANRPRTVLFIFTLITVLIGSQATNIYMDSDLSNYLPKDDPTINLYNEIAEKFQIGQTIIILVDQTDRLSAGYNVRNPRVLEEMDEVGKAIDLYPYDKGQDDGVVSIRSLAELIKNENAKSILAGGQGKKRIPLDQDIIYNYLERINIKSMKGTLYTSSFDVAVIIIQLKLN